MSRSSKPRKSKDIPLHIVDYHNDALQFILKGIGSKRLSFSDNLLIHFDSHPDLLLDEELKKDDVYNKEVLLEKVSIESWIMPLVYAQHINEIVWIKPEWSNQIDDGEYTFYIGRTKDNYIKISAPILYFISALTFTPFDELIDPKKFTLHVVTWDSSEENVTKSQSHILKLIQMHSENYLLDIDLDFFYTLNPFLEMHLKAKMFEQLKGIYSFPDEELANVSAKEALEKRSKFLHEMNTIFSTLNERQSNNEPLLEELDNLLSNIKDKDTFIKVKNLIENLYELYSDDVDWLIVHTAGTTIDDDKRQLPHHLSTDCEMNTYISHLQSFLIGFPNPKMISIARSSTDDYCPSKIADQLQERVHKVLTTSFDAKVDVYNHADEL